MDRWGHVKVLSTPLHPVALPRSMETKDPAEWDDREKVFASV